MKSSNTYKYIIALVIGFILGCFATYQVMKQDTVIKDVIVTTPEKSGKSPVILKPKPLKAIKGDTIIIKGDTIKTENPFNKEMAAKYVDLEKRYQGIDLEKERLKEYLKSIQVRDYAIPYEDSLIKITNNIKAQGEVLSFQQDYTIKEQKIKIGVPIKKNKFGFFSGAELGMNKEFKNIAVKGNIGLQIPKGDIINISYDSDKRFWVGYNYKF